MQIWCPFATRVRAPRDGGSFRSGARIKGVLHTTESMRYTPRTSDYYGSQNWPHATVWIDGDGEAQLAQHIPINRAARAMVNASGGAQTNREAAIQLEIAWTAADAGRMPRELLDLIAAWMRWVERQTGLPRVALEFRAYPASYGQTDVRLSAADWLRFSGWCGHQHVPENAHGDPGLIDVAYLLSDREPEDDMKPEDWTRIEDLIERGPVLKVLKIDGDDRKWLVAPEGVRHINDGAVLASLRAKGLASSVSTIVSREEFELVAGFPAP